MHPAVFWLSLCAALGYALAAVLLKTALGRGSAGLSLNFFSNLAMALLMQALWIFPVEPTWSVHLWKPITCGLFFYLGQKLTFAALARCDVSVATPVLGAKVIFVVFFLSVAGASWPGWRWWLAAAMCSVGVLLVTAQRDFWRQASQHATGTLASLGAAASFGLTDALLQLWVPSVGAGAFAPLMFATGGLVTFAEQLLRTRRCPALPPPGARGVAALGVFLLALQSAILAVAIGYYQDAAGANIVYGSRVVLGVLAAGAVSWWSLRTRPRSEAAHPPLASGLFGRRLLGSILVFAAIAIVLL